MAVLRRLIGRRAASPAATGPASARRTVPTDASPDPAGSREAAEAVAALARGGRFAEAHALAGRALAAAPDDPALLFARATTLLDWGRYRESRAVYEEAQRRGLRSPLLQRHLGWACFRGGDPEAAVGHLRAAAAAEPEGFDAHFCLGVVMEARRDFDAAAAALRRAAELRPGDFQVALLLGKCRLAQGDAPAAETRFREALQLGGEHPAAWTHLGFALARQDRHAEALEAFGRAHALEQADHEGDVDAYFNLAVAYANEDRLEDACRVFEANLPTRPAPKAHFHYGLALLKLGRLDEGWPHHEFRLLLEPHRSTRPPYGKPAWDGQDLAGKRLLIRTDQGIGDAIQFLRYARPLEAMGATVLLKTSPEIEAIGAHAAGVASVEPRDETRLDFDFYVHAASLPKAFGTTLGSIPADVPYLRVDAARSAHWMARLGGAGVPSVGLVWAGNPVHPRDRQRSIALAALAPILAFDGVRFVLLQKGEALAQAASAAFGRGALNLGPELDDLVDTAAVVDQLDLVIGVDTAVVHLAGALGKPVWTLLAKPCDWRWLQDRDDSPWYPTMRLFRQERRDDWRGVVARVAAALRGFLEGGARDSVAPEAPVQRDAARQAAPPAPARAPANAPASSAAAARPGFSAVVETRYGILQYLPGEPLVGPSIGWYGEFLQAEVRLLARIVRPGATVVDVGAGVGARALALSRIVGDAGSVIACETRPVFLRILRENVDANQARSVTVLPMSGAAAEGAESQADAGVGAASAPGTLDSLQLGRLDLVSVDHASGPRAVLRGAEDALWRLRPVLLIRRRDASDVADLARDVKQFAYRCWRMDTPLHDPANFNRRDEDIFDRLSLPALLAIPEETDVAMELPGCIEVSG